MNIFLLGGVQGVQHPYCTKCTVVFAAFLAHPWRKKSYPKRVYDPALLFVKFQLSSYNSFEDMRGPEFTLWGAAPLGRSLAKKFHPQNEYLTLPNCV